MRKESLIIVFYILYFGWLTSIVYLIRTPVVLDYFTTFVAMFYFAFLREKGDLYWFLAGILLLFLIVTSSFNSGLFQINLRSIIDIDPWLPLSWGTTFVTLRKFFLTVSEKQEKTGVYY